MKDMYILVIVLLTSWTAGSWAAWELPCPVTKCPYPEKYATNLPHENDCTKFYKCSWGVPVLQDCPPMDPNNKEIKLHYNRRLQVCDWPWQAGCEICTEASIDDKCPPPDKISDPKDDCNYIDCRNNQTIACPDGTCFSRTCQACVEDRANGNCGTFIPTSTTRTTPTTRTTRTTETTQTTRTTPTTPTTRTTRTTPTTPTTRTTPTTPTTSTTPRVCVEGDRRKRTDCDCTLYDECILNDWNVQECTNGEYYNPNTKKCDDPTNVNCVPNSLLQ